MEEWNNQLWTTLIFASYWGSVPSQRYIYQKNIFQHIIFCKNETCANCGTLNVTTLIWLVWKHEWMLQRCYTKVVMGNKEFQRNTKKVQILKILWIRLFFAKNLRLRKKLKKWPSTNLCSVNKNSSS